MISLLNTLLMYGPELPSYLKVAYSLRYAEETTAGNPLTRVFQTVQRVFSLIGELWDYDESASDIQKNRKKFQKDFDEIARTGLTNTKPICVYFVGTYDRKGAIFGNTGYYYHHYQIQNLQQYFAVAPKLVSSQAEMKAFMEMVKRQNPQREIKFVQVSAHGLKSTLELGNHLIAAEHIYDDLFSDCAPDATILLHSCKTGMGDKNIADEIARKTPGRTVLAPGRTLFFCKPVIKTKNKSPRVVAAAYDSPQDVMACKSFSYSKRMPSQYPYVGDTAFFPNISAMAKYPVARNIDKYLDESNRADQEKVLQTFYRLSLECKTLIAHRVWENNGSPLNRGLHFGEDFLRRNPLHMSVRKAFRSVLNELLNEVREDERASQIKTSIAFSNAVQSIVQWFHHLFAHPVPPPVESRILF